MKLTAQTGGGLSARVMKALGVFGSVQLITVFCGIFKTKLMALWLGPAGVGLFGIFSSAVDMISSFSQLGVRQTAVRDIALNRGLGSLHTTVSVVRRWGWILGSLGAALMLAAAPLLSVNTFGDYGKTLSYMLLAPALLLAGVSSIEQAVMQGLDRLGSLARSTAWSMVLGLILTIPLYYCLRMASIIPSILVYYLVIFVVVMIFRAKGMGAKPGPDLRTTLSRGAGFIRLGFYLTLADAVSQLLSYVFLAFLNNVSGDVEVGYYQAGYTLTNRYAGMLLTAIAVEYYPRIASVSGSRLKLNTLVAHEAGMLILILLPSALLFISFLPMIVRLLYTGEFETAVPFVTLATIGMVVRGISYCMSYVILARGDGRIYMLTELIDAVVVLTLNIVAYKLYGLTGLGASYTIGYLLYMLVIGIVYRRRYHLTLPKRLIYAITGTVILTMLCAVVALFIHSLWILVAALPATLLSLRRLRRLTGRH